MVQFFWHCFSWGQTRPHTAGRRELLRMTLKAPGKSPWAASPRKPGMSMETGHPWTQGRVGHWRHREASRRACWGVYPRATSFMFLARTAAGCSGMAWGGIAILSLGVIS